ncbi:MAG: outer membrane beta-barrel protein [Spongiibacter sp.]
MHNKVLPAAFYMLLVGAAAAPDAALANEALTAEDNRPIRFFVSAGYTHGGDDLLKLQFEKGGSEKITAGGGAMLGAGTILPISQNNELQLSINYHGDSSSAKNGDAGFTRFPVEALIFTRNQHHRFGVGPTLHLNPEVELDIDGQRKQSVTFDQALGAVAEYNFLVSEQVWLGLRYTYIQYETKGVVTEEIDGNHVGLMVHLIF